MNPSKVSLTGILHIALLSWGIAGTAVGQSPKAREADRFKKLPIGWSVTATVIVPQQQLSGISQKLGGQVVRISNTTLTFDGQEIKVNLLECKTAQDAAKVRESLLRIHKGKVSECPQEGKAAIEFVSQDARLIERAYRELGFKPPSVSYSVSFQAAPIEKCDYMVWNKMFNAFLVPEPNETMIRQLSQSFTFGQQLRLRTRGLGSEVSSFTFTPAAQRNAVESAGEITAYSFADLPRKSGLPAAGVTLTVTSEAYALTPSNRKAGQELLSANEHWPSGDVEIIALAKQITSGKANTDDKATAVLEWLKPGTNVRYAGEIKGSRYGVKKVLQQGYGHCWDFSDCFVTLCRASGIPSRQVLGWLYGESGHVWAEVLIDGQGWRQVDPTAGLGCDSRYIPFVASEDGRMPMVYVSQVRISPKAENAALTP